MDRNGQSTWKKVTKTSSQYRYVPVPVFVGCLLSQCRRSTRFMRLREYQLRSHTRRTTFTQFTMFSGHAIAQIVLHTMRTLRHDYRLPWPIPSHFNRVFIFAQ